MFYDQNTVDQIQALLRLSSVTRLETALQYFLQEHRFGYYFFILNTSASLTTPRPITLHNLPEHWYRFYQKDDLMQNDPVVQYALHQALPIDWRHLMENGLYNSGEQRRVMTLRADHGLRAGCTVPLSSGVRLFSWLSLATGKDNEDIWQHIRQFTPYALLLGNVLFESLFNLTDVDGDQRQTREARCAMRLNNRERECLIWASEGKTNSEIGQILSISERTVIYHVNHACKKLHARNRQQAVTKAVLLRQLPMENLRLPIFGESEDTMH